MARVTVEDCVDKVESRFDLVLYSAFRSREIAENKLNSETLEEELIESLQIQIDVDEADDHYIPLI